LKLSPLLLKVSWTKLGRKVEHLALFVTDAVQVRERGTKNFDVGVEVCLEDGSRVPCNIRRGVCPLSQTHVSATGK